MSVLVVGLFQWIILAGFHSTHCHTATHYRYAKTVFLFMPSQSLPVSLSLTFSLSFSHQMNFNHGAFISNTHMLHLHTALATTPYATISAYTHIAERTLAYFYNANSGKRKVIIGNCCLNLKNSITLLELRGNFKAPQLHLYMRFAYMCVTSA